MWSGDDEAGLLASWRRGDSEAVRRVVDLHGPAMLRVALALCPRCEDAEEVVQDALLGAHRALASFDARRGGLRSWLIAVTANRARQVRRGQSRYFSLLERLRRERYEPVPPGPVSDDLAFARERLAALPSREREAFVLVEMEELTSIEAGKVMRISHSTVRVLVARARSRLQRAAELSPARSLRLEGKRR
jgi:RNA polymerase sigma-70 factor (ECF subfamily)